MGPTDEEVVEMAAEAKRKENFPRMAELTDELHRRGMTHPEIRERIRLAIAGQVPTRLLEPGCGGGVPQFHPAA